MDLVTLLNGLVDQLADAQAAADELAQTKYDEGFAAGVASVTEGDKLYTQADVDAIVTPLNDRILALEAQVMALQESVATQIAEAMAKFKMDLLTKYESQQVVESDTETGFKDLLK